MLMHWISFPGIIVLKWSKTPGQSEMDAMGVLLLCLKVSLCLFLYFLEDLILHCISFAGSFPPAV